MLNFKSICSISKTMGRPVFYFLFLDLGIKEFRDFKFLPAGRRNSTIPEFAIGF